MAKFPSQAWANEFMSIVNASATYARVAKEWEGDFYFVINGPQTEAVYVDLWHGKCRKCIYTTDLSMQNPLFKIKGSADKWQRVITGQLDPIQALITRQLRLDGSMITIMKNVKAAQELVKCATEVESNF